MNSRSAKLLAEMAGYTEIKQLPLELINRVQQIERLVQRCDPVGGLFDREVMAVVVEQWEREQAAQPSSRE